MPIKKILIAVRGSETSRSTIGTGLLLAATLKAHAEVLHVLADPLHAVPAFGDGMTGRMADQLVSISEKDVAERAKLARRMFDQYCTGHQVPVVTGKPPAGEFSAAWLEKVGYADALMRRRGRLADMIVLGKPTFKPRLATSMTAQAGLFETGRPVLIAPPETPKGDIGRNIAIAWNGSAEASRAVAAATNFFGAAEKVTVLTAESERTPAEAAQELADYLSLHGVRAETRIFAHMADKPLGGAALLKACDDVGADLLVMGAFIAGGFRELIMGNATQQVLSEATIPVLMGH
ncbi:universal stress protein [Shumkonia mesophila]|uniref:universal stress protein n=1 Tax=Shumkonia mesophila TaxID=2838854 RepID=UPI00293442F4|nr:universal stress protein [Shumkonia mesophila]